MRKLGHFFLSLAMLLYVLPLSSAQAAASKYTGGLLDGVALSVGPVFGNATSTASELTDNNGDNFKNLGASVAWYTFSSPKSISAVIAKWNSTYPVKVELYDAGKNLLSTYVPPVNDGVVSLPDVVSNVSSVVLKPVTASSILALSEWNVFTTPSFPPVTPAFNGSRGGDRVVDLFWNSTSAKSYTVKRSTSTKGPYVAVASNLKTTSYTDTAVVNDTTYYYVVAAVNEAGESPLSAELAVKPSSTKYTKGLLDGLPLQVGSSFGNTTSTTLDLTDNNGDNFKNLGASVAWYTFSSPQSISAVIAKWNATYPVKVEFYDAGNNLLSTYVPSVNDGVESLPAILANVSSVVLKPATASSILALSEWNVFTKPSFPPVTPAFNWSRGGDRVVDLYWNSTSAKSYTVKRSTSSKGPYTIVASNVKNLFFTDKTVSNDTTYYYVVSAVNEAGESPISAEIVIKPTATKYTGGLLDGIAINVGPVFGSVASTTLELTDNNGTTGKNFGSVIAWYTFALPKDIQSTIVKWNSSYPVKVEFYNAGNTLLGSYVPTGNDALETLPSPILNVSSVVLKPVTPSSPLVAFEWNVFGKEHEAVPTAPQNVKATAEAGSINLTWSGVSNATGYKVKRSATAGGPYTEIASVTGAVYTDANVNGGTTYYYVLTAINRLGESPASREVSAKSEAPTIPAPLAPLNVSAVGGTLVKVTWDLAPDAVTYKIKRSVKSSGPYEEVASVTNAIYGAYYDVNVRPGTTYYYVMTAVNAGGESPISAEASAAAEYALIVPNAAVYKPGLTALTNRTYRTYRS